VQRGRYMDVRTVMMTIAQQQSVDRAQRESQTDQNCGLLKKELQQSCVYQQRQAHLWLGVYRMIPPSKL
jgi:hypothetical protein